MFAESQLTQRCGSIGKKLELSSDLYVIA